MKMYLLPISSFVGLAVSVFIAADLLCAQASPAAKPEHRRVSLEVAREQAALAHQIYASTLDVVHQHFFRNDHAILPARAVEDVFEKVARKTQVEARWIAVNTKAMSVNHDPESEFELHAASEIGEGKEFVERIEEGYYRSATSIPLGSRCIGCHTGVFSAPPKSPRFAALVISIPIQE